MTNDGKLALLQVKELARKAVNTIPSVCLSCPSRYVKYTSGNNSFADKYTLRVTSRCTLASATCPYGQSQATHENELQWNKRDIASWNIPRGRVQEVIEGSLRTFMEDRVKSMGSPPPETRPVLSYGSIRRALQDSIRFEDYSGDFGFDMTSTSDAVRVTTPPPAPPERVIPNNQPVNITDEVGLFS